MASILKVNTIQDATNSNTALTIDSSGNVHGAGLTLQTLEGFTYTRVTSTSETFVDTGCSVAITPKFSTSKIFVAYNVTMRFGHTDGGRQALFRKIDSGSYSNIITYSRHVIYQNHSNGSYYQGQFLSFSYVDSPNTTGVVTYSHATDAFGGATTEMNPNHSSGDTQTWQLMEIQA